MEGRDRLERSYESRLDRPIDEVFAWTSDVWKLDELTPPWFVLDPIAPPAELFVGAEIEYRFRWRRVALRWRSRITDWNPPHYFAYEQARGPFREFRHEHRFRSEHGGTRMVDRVIFRTWGGRWLDRWVAGPDLDRVFSYRQRALRRGAAETVRLELRTGAAGCDSGGAQSEAESLAKRMP